MPGGADDPIELLESPSPVESNPSSQVNDVIDLICHSEDEIEETPTAPIGKTKHSSSSVGRQGLKKLNFVESTIMMLNEEQKAVLKYVCRPDNPSIFLTGSAGTGEKGVEGSERNELPNCSLYECNSYLYDELISHSSLHSAPPHCRKVFPSQAHYRIATESYRGRCGCCDSSNWYRGDQYRWEHDPLLGWSWTCKRRS